METGMLSLTGSFLIRVVWPAEGAAVSPAVFGKVELFQVLLEYVRTALSLPPAV